MKVQCVVINTVRQIEIPALLDSWLQTHLLPKCCVHKKEKIGSPYIFIKTKHAYVLVFLSPIKLCICGL